MKTQRIFPGVLLIGVGFYYLLQHFSIPFNQQLLSWPSLLLLIGSAFLLQVYIGREYSMLFPGVLLVGLAIQFHLVSLITGWLNEWWVYSFIIGLAFLLSSLKTKQGSKLLGIALIILSILSYASINPFIWLNDAYSFLSSLWPIFLIGLGLYLLMKRR